MYFRLKFPDGLEGYFATREGAEKARDVHREHGDDPEIVAFRGEFFPPIGYGESGRLIPLEDSEILAYREAILNRDKDPRVGDFVEFPGGELRRIAYIWPDGGVQTCHVGASFYLGEHGCSMSGSLFRSIPGHSLTLTDQTRPGGVWFFHENQPRANNGVRFNILFRVYASSVEAPS